MNKEQELEHGLSFVCDICGKELPESLRAEEFTCSICWDAENLFIGSKI